MTFGMQKLEWFGFQRVKKFEGTLFIRFDRIHERDGRTYRQTDAA